LPSTPWESVGGAGREKKLEVEDRLPACSPSSPNFRELEFPASEEIFRVKEPSEFDDHLQQRRELLSPRLCRAMGHQERRGIPGRMNEDSEIG
jgi:hypothetical protein